MQPAANAPGRATAVAGRPRRSSAARGAPPEWVAAPMPLPPVPRALLWRAPSSSSACCWPRRPGRRRRSRERARRSRPSARQVAELDVRAGAAAAAHNLAIDRLDLARETLRRTRGELRTARRDLATSRDVLAERLVDLYVSGQPTFLQVLLTSGSVGEAYEASEVIDQAARGDARVLEAVRERRERLRILEERQTAAEAARERERGGARSSGSRSWRRSPPSASALLADARADLRRLIKEERERRARLGALEAARRATLSSLPYASSARGGGRVPRRRLRLPRRRRRPLQRRLARPAAGRALARGHRHLRRRGHADRGGRRRLALQRRLQRPRRLAAVAARRRPGRPSTSPTSRPTRRRPARARASRAGP